MEHYGAENLEPNGARLKEPMNLSHSFQSLSTPLSVRPKEGSPMFEIIILCKAKSSIPLVQRNNINILTRIYRFESIFDAN